MEEEYKIKIEGVSKVFGHGSQKALALLDEGMPKEKVMEKTKCAVGAYNVDLSIREGDTFVIMGLSGSGKSTLIRCINLLNRPTRGRICIDGENIVEYDKDQLKEFRRHKVSMVFQHFGLLGHRNVLRNVEYGLEVRGIDKDKRREMSMQALETVGLKGWESYHPRQLSGGMKQRVGLARALANEPDILLMDEPFSALDPITREQLQNELLKLQDELHKTIVFVTHDIDEALKIGDRIAVMAKGSILQYDKPEDILKNPVNGFVESFVGSDRLWKTPDMLRAEDIMSKKVVEIGAGRSVAHAIELMKEHNTNVLAVVDKVSPRPNKLLGIVGTNRLKGVTDHSVKMGDIMKTDVVEIPHSMNLTEVLGIRKDKKIQYSPVVDDDGKVIGIITNASIVNVLTDIVPEAEEY